MLLMPPPWRCFAMLMIFITISLSLMLLLRMTRYTLIAAACRLRFVADMPLRCLHADDAMPFTLFSPF